ncbi:MAG TPA: ADOP family duplicated permease [Vicinamibacterales bacterium]|nr:ADOP family duplicated permease [Vicinamibacterales bacterium]
MGTVFRRLWYWVRQREIEYGLEEELEFHRALKQQELEAEGLSPEDARLTARRELGNVTRAREDSRAVWMWPWLETVWHDARYALRAVRRQPGFVLLSVVVLGVAIGLNASLFTVFAAAALRPMTGVAEPATLVVVSGRVPQIPDLLSGLSIPEFDVLAAEATTAELAAERRMPVRFDSGGGARDMTAAFVTGNYFELLGVHMEHGRGVLADEDTRGASVPVAVLSYSLWYTQFGADPAIVGRTVRVAGQPHTVIGVTSRAFAGSERSRVWLPLASLPVLRPGNTGLDRPQDCCAEVYARLRPGATRAQVATELQTLSDRFRRTVGQDVRPIVLTGTQALRGRRGDNQSLAIIGVLFLGIMMVLLLACANVGNLLLARAATRRGEIGVRLSLGAARSRVVRQLLTEGLILVLIAAAAGLAIAAWLPRFVMNTVARQPAPFDIGPDGLVFAYTAAIAGIACLAAALAPALHATRGGITATLKGDALSRSRVPLRSLLLGVQLALTVVLLTSAGLLLRGVAAARELDLGFRVEGVSEVAVELPEPDYDAERMRTFLADLSTALQSAGLTSVAFAAPGRATDEARLPGRGANQTSPVERLDVSSSYFALLDVPMTAGRSFTDRDRNPGAAVVNETFARRFWPGENAVGRSFVAENRTLEVIGVVRDARVLGLDPVPPSYFVPLTGPRGTLFPVLLLRSNQPSEAAAVTAVVERLEPRGRVTVTPMRNRFDFELAELALAPLAASVLGLFALGLATVGMFGAFAYAVRQRTREIGIRLALGARSADVVRSILSGNARVVALGLGVGLLGAAAVSQILRSLLFGLSPLDPLTYAGVALLLAAVAFVASYAPTRIALRVDAATTLRAE